MYFREKVETLIGKTTDYDFSRGCSLATIYIKETIPDGTLIESDVVNIVARCICQLREKKEDSNV